MSEQTPASAPVSALKGSKKKVIAMVVAGIAIVGGLGAIAGLVGGDEDKPEVDTPSEVSSGVLDPSPIGNIDSLPGSDATPEPTSSASPSIPAPSGEGISLAGIATIPQPEGWSVLGQSDADLLMQTDEGSWVYALVGVEDPSADAAALVTQGVQELLSTENYSQLQVGTPAAVQPYGSLVSIASVDYEALWADAQGSIPLRGQLIVGVRQDGSTLVMTVEHSPPEDFDASRADWEPIIEDAFNNFGAS